jgi:hypothetical protein
VAALNTPGKVTPLKSEAPSKEYLSKPAAKGSIGCGG